MAVNKSRCAQRQQHWQADGALKLALALAWMEVDGGKGNCLVVLVVPLWAEAMPPLGRCWTHRLRHSTKCTVQNYPVNSPRIGFGAGGAGAAGGNAAVTWGTAEGAGF